MNIYLNKEDPAIKYIPFFKLILDYAILYCILLYYIMLIFFVFHM